MNRIQDRKNVGRPSKKQKKSRIAEVELESKLGYEHFTQGDKRLGWLLTFASSSLEDEETGRLYSCVDLYFVTQDGSYFKAKHKFLPYLYVVTKGKMETDVEAYLRRRYESQIANVEIVLKEDLDLKNHLSGLRKAVLKVSFDTVQQLMEIKKDLQHVVERNRVAFDAMEAYDAIITGKKEQRFQDFCDYIVDLREYDVPYHVRFGIDNDIRCGQWYDVQIVGHDIFLKGRSDILQRAETRICAFDIETTKLPLKFPDSEYDMIMMISYMVDGMGFLIVNRECVGDDVQDIEYTPKPEFEGCFKVNNVKNELALLECWFSHMKELKPGIYVTYNGDFFDWPFIEVRAAHHGLKMIDEIGFSCDKNLGECRAKFACHLDCYAWVKRDSYLPQGSQGLKAVTKAKLGYDPVEVNPEDMVRFAKEKPQMMASYSVSDAVATFYLYKTYVHPFIFSLATIIPMSPDEVLRKGSGTLCEMLLMVQAYKANVICPNKHLSDEESFYNGQLLESETYIGGHVECLESGVFRSDIPTSFKLDSCAYNQLIENLDRDLQYAIRVEGKLELEEVLNYDEVRTSIMEKLVRLRDQPIREECPLIYHLDVAAMYPNIILTNRLQPPSIVTDDVCTACDFNRPDKTCLRKLQWMWRGEMYTAKRSDYYHLKKQIESEYVEGKEGLPSKSFIELPKAEQQFKIKDRLRKFCQKAYKRVLDKPVTELREAGICMRENSFYVDTVRSFRDRRYEYKGLNKTWKGQLSESKASGNILKVQEAQDMVVLYDSLQLAHKCILNSFYGYVMRKGARWYSMEMAGVVTYTGAKIIQNARLLVDKIGKPLELDTDGIWCVLPGSFPENFTFKTKHRKLTLSYPCVMLNVDVAEKNTNDQYQTLIDPANKLYETRSECSIEFEVDGPYRAMIIPASKEEGILIKKRYAVFNNDGSLAELKGFEIKRRGELKLIKVFQSELFEKFLHGSTLEECYSAVAAVADRWLDFLDNKGKDIADNELLDYISESSTMSKSLVDYGEQKSCAVTTAKRLADFLGDTMVKDKGLRCQYIVACEPNGTPVSERAVPVAIFETDVEIMKFYLRKWCKASSDVDIRSIIDWAYYKQRLTSAIQKIITIPAAMQKISNPVPRVSHPDWLHKKVREKEDSFRQRKLADMFPLSDKKGGLGNIGDLEDFGSKQPSLKPHKPVVHRFEKSCKLSIERTNQGNASCDKNKRQRLNDLHDSNVPVGVPDSQHVKRKKTGRIEIGSYYKSHEMSLTQSHWQIIQIVPTAHSSRLSAWVLVDGFMLQIPITVPRVFYLNYRTQIEENFPGRCVTKVLPRGKRAHNLYEVIIDEDKFEKEKQKLGALLANPEVEGIYETQMPLEYHAMLQVGCVCKLDKSSRKRNIQDGWALNELHMKTTTECPYLESSLSFFYLFHSNSNGRGLFILSFPSLQILHVIIVNSYQNKDLTVAFLERQFREACDILSVIVDPCTLMLEYFGNINDAEKYIQRIISETRKKQSDPTVALIECPDSLLLKSGIPILTNFPCVTMPANALDSQYQVVGWQQMAARIGLLRCAASRQWLNERLSLARYAHVPLGNFGSDWIIFTSDVLYSRALRDHQMVLWTSSNGTPDLGTISYDFFSNFEEEYQPVLISHGAYRKFSVEFKIHNLAVNALLKSHLVNEMEGGAILESELEINSEAYIYDEQPCFDDMSSSAAALRILRQLVHRCLIDTVESGNIYSNVILHHLHRWLCSPQSKLRDPTLHRALQKMMQKVFALLSAEIRKLGGTIIFANFSKIIIDTGKLSLSAAKAYSDSLLKTLQRRELFYYIELEPVQFWYALLFEDEYNYGGIPVHEDEISNLESEDNIQRERLQVDIVSNWKMVEHFPKLIQDQFIRVVSEYLFISWNFARKLELNKTAHQDDSILPSVPAELFDTQLVQFLKEQIATSFSDKLFAIVSQLSHTNDILNPAVQFINNVCGVLANDRDVHQEILVMKRNLLKYVRVGEFSPEADFIRDRPSFIIPNVICRYCNNCRDLDVCNESGDTWQCGIAECGQPYDRETMENTLMQILRCRAAQFSLQDLKCVRCKQVKAVRMADVCGCGGLFRTTIDASDFLFKINILRDVAIRQNFQLLHQCILCIIHSIQL